MTSVASDNLKYTHPPKFYCNGAEYIRVKESQGENVYPHAILNMGQVYSWCSDKISEWYRSWSDGDGHCQNGETVRTFFKAGCNWEKIMQLVNFGLQYFRPKECKVSQCPERGIDSPGSLKELKVTPWVKGVSLSSELKCPLSYNNIVFSECDHDGGVITSKDGIKLTIRKNAIKEGNSVIFYIAVDLYGPFVIPSDCETDLNLSSPYYWVGVAGSCDFQEPIEVEFEHFGACDSSHYQLLCCGDDDESYTMRPVDYKLSFRVQGDISLCRFQTHHFCSCCLRHDYKEDKKDIHRIGVLYLKPAADALEFMNTFLVQIWFSLVISYCLNRNKELYERRGLKLESSYLFEAPTNKSSKHCFTLSYDQKVIGWCISGQSTEIEAKEINFFNYYKSKNKSKNIANLQASEENMLFPPRLILHIRNSDHIPSTDLDIDITITLYNNKKHQKELKHTTFKLFKRGRMLTEVLSITSEDGIALPDHNCQEYKPTPKELLKYLKYISCKWRPFAIQLGIDEYRVGVIDRNNPNDVEGKSYDVLDHWLQVNKSACWCHFIKALNAVDLHDIAEKAKKEHLTQSNEAMDVASSPENKNVSLDDLVRYFKQIPDDSLQRFVTCLLQHNTVDLSSCANKQEKIERVSAAYLREENPSWTNIYEALKEAKCDDVADYIEAIFL